MSFVQRIRSFLECLRVVALAPDEPGERAEHVIAAPHTLEDVGEVEGAPQVGGHVRLVKRGGMDDQIDAAPEPPNYAGTSSCCHA